MPPSAKAAIDELVETHGIEGDAEVSIDSLDGKSWTNQGIVRAS
jgi:hypothetical protein